MSLSQAIASRSLKKTLLVLLLVLPCAPACEQRKSNKRLLQEFSEEFDEGQQEEKAGVSLAAKAKLKKDRIVVGKLERNAIYFYSAGRHNGNLGGRKGANQICEQAISQIPEGFRIAAFLSVNTNDRLEQFPLNWGVPTRLPIKGLLSKKLIAKQWADLFTNYEKKQIPKLQASLLDAGVFEDGANRLERYEGFFWAGNPQEIVRKQDAAQKYTCSSWSSEEGWGAIGGNHGIFHPSYQGQKNQAYAYPWYDYQMIMPCQSLQELLCLLYPRKGMGA